MNIKKSGWIFVYINIKKVQTMQGFKNIKQIIKDIEFITNLG